ncbi:MAG: STAS domain-containing protein [Nitrospirae bacterium]|nr:STAS domain-containing protein [Nitrospirota bacterium]
MHALHEQQTNIGFLTLSGDLTIEYADELKSLLLTALSGADQVVLDIKEVSSCDLSALQVFCSAHRSALQQKKQIALVESRSKVFRCAVTEAGYRRHVGCPADTDQSCFWVQRFC